MSGSGSCISSGSPGWPGRVSPAGRDSASGPHGGLPYTTPQAWSAALHAHRGRLDGIAYNARHDDEALCYAIFERAGASIQELHRETGLDSDWFWSMAEPYGVGLAQL